MKALVSAYAINPYKGSEDGTGWNWVYHLSKKVEVVAITRKNNQPHIEQYQKEHPELDFTNLEFRYYDLPNWAMFWKKGERGALLYFYLWQLFLPLFVKTKKLTFDVAHGLNFHCDWLPSFLWVLGKPFIWGPVGHHPMLPFDLIRTPLTRKDKFFETLKWRIKVFAWKYDPFLQICKHNAKFVLTVNPDVGRRLDLGTKEQAIPAVGFNYQTFEAIPSGDFNVLSVGRFVSLKGFDLTIDAFYRFMQMIPVQSHDKITLRLVGRGPLTEWMRAEVNRLGLNQNVEIIKWVKQEELKEYYKKASVFSFPSHEGAGMVIPEAQSFKLPIVCLNNDGPGYLSGPDAIRVSTDNREATITEMANAFIRLYIDQAYWKINSLSSFKHFMENHEWNQKIDTVISLYNKITSNETHSILSPA